MRLRYPDGSEDDDALFDKPLGEQREYTARALALASVEDRIIPDLDRLLAVRRVKGRRAFYREIGMMLSPEHH